MGLHQIFGGSSTLQFGWCLFHDLKNVILKFYMNSPNIIGIRVLFVFFFRYLFVDIVYDDVCQPGKDLCADISMT